ncbi:maltase 2-like [Myzus persicae]|uniref:maltase 2-like n=1 Tax=Myzus persicae TaxID=13164 RepID=UPI000B938EE1|nr:maltase 2-like [Myzus persicae]XP_022175217.1 maltase 2-like [Myzus persicae]XP_022175218.1 maltase 2-like [Myzus persicae]
MSIMYWTCLIITCIQLTYCKVIVPPTGVLDWWQNSIIYEIFPLSFKDSDGDGSGDFKGITQKLDYLVDIGVTAIWITPFFESPLESAGYDITNYLDVQNIFGTIDDFKDLLNDAHSKNLKVIMDFVPNHTSNKHIWFEKSVNNETDYTNYYIWKDAKNQDEVIKNNSIIPIVPNNWQRICDDASAWIWHNTRKQFYFTQFVPNLPDLNFRNEKVHEEMKNILNYWLELGIDGVRIDALKHVYESEEMKDEPIIDSNMAINYNNLNHIYTADQDEVYDLIKEWRLLLDDFKQNENTRIIITESYSSNSVLFKYYTSGAQIPTNFNLLGDYHYTPKDYEREIENWITKMPLGATFNSVLQNHDKIRFPTSYGTELIDGMNALSLFLPGVAIVLYGGEIGMEDIADKINYARAPMQWDDTKNAGFTNSTHEPWVAVNPDYVTRNVQSESYNPKSYLNFFKSISKLRQTETFKKGGLAMDIFNDTVFVLNRFLPGHENYTLIINMDTNYTQHVRLSDQIQYLNYSLAVVVGSENSNFNPGNLILTAEWLHLSPGATIVLTDSNSIDETATGSKHSSFSTQLYITLKVVLLCLFFTKICSL